MNKKDQNCFIVDIAIPRDSRLSEREGNKVEKIPRPEQSNYQKCEI